MVAVRQPDGSVKLNQMINMTVTGNAAGASTPFPLDSGILRSLLRRPRAHDCSTQRINAKSPRPRHRALAAATLLLVGAIVGPAIAQPGPSGPPAVGVVSIALHPVTESYEFTGRVEAIGRVQLVARVAAFLEEQRFTEGAEVKKGDLLYKLERGPYEADVAAKAAAVAQADATHTNDRIQLARAQGLRGTPAGMQMAVDNATAQERSTAAQLMAAQAQMRQSQINLDYTDIAAPIDGRIGRTAVTVGNVVGPSSGVLATIVSQDPMYVTFPVPMRTALDLRTRYASKGGFAAVAIKLLLPDGRTYDQTGKLGFVDIDVSQGTDTITLRGTVPNPVLAASAGGDGRLRELTADEFVTVVLEGAEPVQRLTLPREAVLSDQQGDFVYVVDAGNKARRRPVQLGQSTAETAVIAAGLKEGERVVVEGVQRLQPDAEVSPGPASAETPVTASPAVREGASPSGAATP